MAAANVGRTLVNKGKPGGLPFCYYVDGVMSVACRVVPRRGDLPLNVAVGWGAFNSGDMHMIKIS